MTREQLRAYYRVHRAYYYNDTFYNYQTILKLLPATEAPKYLLPENYSFEEWLELSKEAGHLLRQDIHNQFSKQVEWDGTIESNPKRESHYSRTCRYNGKLLRYDSLLRKLKKAGIPNHIEEAKKYVVS